MIHLLSAFNLLIDDVSAIINNSKMWRQRYFTVLLLGLLNVANRFTILNRPMAALHRLEVPLNSAPIKLSIRRENHEFTGRDSLRLRPLASTASLSMAGDEISKPNLEVGNAETKSFWPNRVARKTIKKLLPLAGSTL